LHFPDYPWWGHGSARAGLNWQQVCVVQVIHAQIQNIVQANYSTGAQAIAELWLMGLDQGDCGDDITVSVTLSNNDGVVYNVNVDQDDFFSDSGAYVNQTVGRDQDTYKLTVTVMAPNAETHEQRANRTSGRFAQPQTNDTMSHTRSFSGTNCSLSIDNLEFVAYTAEGDYSAPIVAGYSA